MRHAQMSTATTTSAMAPKMANPESPHAITDGASGFGFSAIGRRV